MPPGGDQTLPELERVAGIEPASSAWKAEVLPLNYTRNATRFGQPQTDQPFRLQYMVEGGGFEPPKLTRQIYSLIPLATREPLPKKVVHFPRSAASCQQRIPPNRYRERSQENMELARGVEPPTG